MLGPGRGAHSLGQLELDRDHQRRRGQLGVDQQVADDDEGGELAGFLCQVCQFQGEPVRVLDVEGLLGSGVLEILAQTRRQDR
mgnify:CR=1 FL=1